MTSSVRPPVRQRARPLEMWRIVVTRDGVTWPDYEVSSLGRVRRRTSYRHWRAGDELRQFVKSGYPVIGLHSRGLRPRQLYVHELVCVAFRGLPHNRSLMTRHLDGDKRN